MQIVEVSPRDGLQNESRELSTKDKAVLVARAAAAGITRIEVTSFVHPRAVPQMADAEQVMALLDRAATVSYAGLVMNQRGLDRALAAGVDEVNVVVVSTDTFSGRNQNTSTFEGCALAAELVSQARAAQVFTTITVGAAFGCPFEGEVPLSRLGAVLDRVVQAGPDEIALADTIGVAVPADIVARTALLKERAGDRIGSRLHLHDTRNTAIANAVAAHRMGVHTLDASIGGAGGCPFAPNATGNVATEDLTYLFDRMGVETGLDLDALIESAAWLESRLERRLPGSLHRAGGFPGSAVR